MYLPQARGGPLAPCKPPMANHMKQINPRQSFPRLLLHRGTSHWVGSMWKLETSYHTFLRRLFWKFYLTGLSETSREHILKGYITVAVASDDTRNKTTVFWSVKTRTDIAPFGDKIEQWIKQEHNSINNTESSLDLLGLPVKNVRAVWRRCLFFCENKVKHEYLQRPKYKRKTNWKKYTSIF